MRNVVFLEGSFSEFSGVGYIDFRLNATGVKWRAEFSNGVPKIRMSRYTENKIFERIFGVYLLQILRPVPNSDPHWRDEGEFHDIAMAWSIGFNKAKEIVIGENIQTYNEDLPKNKNIDEKDDGVEITPKWCIENNAENMGNGLFFRWIIGGHIVSCNRRGQVWINRCKSRIDYNRQQLLALLTALKGE